MRIMKTATRGTHKSSVTFDRAASGKVGPGHGGSNRMDQWSLGPFGICDYDGPETVRLRKYATGTHMLLQEIRVETATTPREVVWSKNKAKLFRYLRHDERPSEGVEGRRSVPVLLTYGFVLKPYVLDLVPGNSLVEYLVDEGFDVYMLDLGVSDAKDVELLLEELVLDYVHGAVQKVLETSGAEEISLHGQSQGGTLCAIYASLFPRGPLKNLVLLSAPTEFAPRNPGLLGLWTLVSSSSGAYFDPAMVPKIFGNLPTDLASQVINSMASLQATAVGMAARPFGHGFGVYDAALGAIGDLADRDVSVRSWLAVSKWVDDAAPFPARSSEGGLETSTSATSSSRGRWSCAGRGWIFRTSSAPCSTSRASETTSFPPLRPRPRPPSPAVRTRSLSLWTPGTWGCSSGRGPRTYGYASGTGSHPAVANLQPLDLSMAVAISTPAILSDDLRTVVRRPCNRRTSPCGWTSTPAGRGSRQISSTLFTEMPS